jgi:uncharacterized protein (DUF1697 family)
MTRFIGLLRAVNVGGKGRVVMSELRDLCTQAGLADVRSYVNSGNLVFTAAGQPDALENRMEAAIEARYGFTVDVMVRSAADWSSYVRSNPFLELAKEHPARVMLLVPKRPLDGDAVLSLREKAVGEERVEAAGEVVWIYFAQGAGRSKLASGKPGRIPVTTRNWRTVLKLEEMAKAAAE